MPSHLAALFSRAAPVCLIRVRDQAGAFRVIYVAQFEEAVYVLHCFAKKTRKTAKADLDLAMRRLKVLMQERDG